MTTVIIKLIVEEINTYDLGKFQADTNGNLPNIVVSHVNHMLWNNITSSKEEFIKTIEREDYHICKNCSTVHDSLTSLDAGEYYKEINEYIATKIEHEAVCNECHDKLILTHETSYVYTKYTNADIQAVKTLFLEDTNSTQDDMASKLKLPPYDIKAIDIMGIPSIDNSIITIKALLDNPFGDDMVFFASIRNNENEDIYYHAVGKIADTMFSGVVKGYEGGGETSEWYVFNNMFMPTAHKDENPIEHDTAIAMMNVAMKDNGFYNICMAMQDKYTDYEAESNVHSIKKEYIDLVEDGQISIGKEFQPLNYGNRTWDGGEAEYYKTVKEFTDANLEIDELLKENLEQMIIQDTNGELSSSELVNDAVVALLDDDIYGLIVEDIQTEMFKYLNTIVEVIELRAKGSEAENHALANINIKDCEVCTECGTGLLPESECYTDADTDKPYCTECCFFDEGDDVYRAGTVEAYLERQTENSINLNDMRMIILNEEWSKANPDNMLPYFISKSCTHSKLQEIVKITQAVYEYATTDFTTEKMIDIKETLNVEVERYEDSQGEIAEDYNGIFQQTLAFNGFEWKVIRSFVPVSI